MSGPLADLDWIAVDWGTSTLRAWAMDAGGRLLARAASADGMLALTPDGFEPALLALAGGWLPAAGGVPVPAVICGMAGARQGWREAPYRTVPCAPVDGSGMTAAMGRDPRLSAFILPGLNQHDPPDVMRGEETQIAGLLARLGPVDATVCLPGTHAKWAAVEGGRVTGFTTVMTGELFGVISKHTILRHSLSEAGEDDAAFLGAVAQMLADPARLTGALFSIRAGALLTGLDGVAARARLAGLLIGAELAAQRERWDGRTVHLIGSGLLVTAYASALAANGATPVAEDGEALTLAGLAAARALLTEATP